VGGACPDGQTCNYCGFEHLGDAYEVLGRSSAPAELSPEAGEEHAVRQDLLYGQEVGADLNNVLNGIPHLLPNVPFHAHLGSRRFLRQESAF
jgi:hypothetical protein